MASFWVETSTVASTYFDMALMLRKGERKREKKNIDLFGYSEFHKRGKKKKGGKKGGKREMDPPEKVHAPDRNRDGQCVFVREGKGGVQKGGGGEYAWREFTLYPMGGGGAAGSGPGKKGEKKKKGEGERKRQARKHVRRLYPHSAHWQAR